MSRHRDSQEAPTKASDLDRSPRQWRGPSLEHAYDSGGRRHARTGRTNVVDAALVQSANQVLPARLIALKDRLFESDHESYRWLNDLVCIAEGGISATGPDMVINVYAGIHEM